MKKYFTEEEKKAAAKAKQKRWRDSHKEQERERLKIYRSEHKEDICEWRKRYNSTHKEENRKYCQTSVRARAIRQYHSYKRADIKYQRGECTLTPDYLINVLYPKGCCYCGETDPLKLGADRIDNNKPHTIENCVCSCWNCNMDRQRRDFEEYFNERYMDSILV